MKKLSKFGQQVLVAGAVFVSRLGWLLPANISPVGSFGFFGNNWLYFAGIITFDWLVGGFYPNFWVTYLGFAAYPALGYVAKKFFKNKIGVKAALIPLASFLFFLISNFGVWWSWYPQTLEGLISCYSLALPFYSRTLIGDLIFGYGYLAISSSKKAFLTPNVSFKS